MPPPADYEVRVDIYEDLTNGEIVLASLVDNNERYNLKDFETYSGVVQAHELGRSVEDIAQALGGRDEAEILQWLRIGELEETIFAEFTAGRVSIEQAQAYGATDDHQLQLAAFEAMKAEFPHQRTASRIRSWMKFNAPVAERELLYVGEGAYAAAGGALQFDLFASPPEPRRLSKHPQILRELVERKRAELMTQLRERTGRDLRFITTPPRTEFQTVDELLRVDVATDPAADDEIALPDGAIVGCILLEIDGRPHVSWWWPSRAAKYGEGRTSKPMTGSGAARGASRKPGTGLAEIQALAGGGELDPATNPEALDHKTMDILRSQRRATLRAGLVDDARAGGTAAEDYLIFAQLRMMVHPTSHARNAGMPRLLFESGPEFARDFVAKMPGTKVWQDALAELSRRPMLASDSIEDAFLSFLAEPPEIRALAAAIVVGFALERSLATEHDAIPIHDLVAARVGLDDDAGVRRYWTPPEQLLEKLPVEQRLAIARPFVEQAAFGPWSLLKPAQLTRNVLAVVTGAGDSIRQSMRDSAATWVHPLLRFAKRGAGPEDPIDPGVNDVQTSAPQWPIVAEELEAAE